MSEKPTENQIAGCCFSMWQLVVTLPIWLMLTFAILNALGDAAPVYAWVLYWIYVPATILGAIMGALIRLLWGPSL